MKLALRELRRRPGRFTTAGVILVLIALLLMFLGGLLDGLISSSTGALRVQPGQQIVFSENSRDSLTRSRIEPEVRAEVTEAAGDAAVGGLGSVQLGGRLEGRDTRDLVPVVLFGYELAPKGLPAEVPAEGEVYADNSLKAEDVEVGTEFRLGPARSLVTVIGFIDDSQYAGQGTLWGSLATWREVQGANRPGETLGDDVVQALVIDADGADAVSAQTIDHATSGATNIREP